MSLDFGSRHVYNQINKTRHAEDGSFLVHHVFWDGGDDLGLGYPGE